MAPGSLSRWNGDVLLDIFSYVSARDLACAALTCRDWAPLARRLLYSRVSFDSQGPTSSLLVRTLRTCPHVRQLIRFLSICICPPVDDIALLDWMELLPKRSLQIFQITHLKMDNDALVELIFRCEAVRTASQLIATAFSITSEERLRICLGFPFLETFCAALPANLNILKLKSTAPAPKLKRLSIRIDRYSPLVVHLITVFGPSLERLDIDMVAGGINQDAGTALTTALSSQARNIRELSIRSRYATAPFFDDLVQNLPSLLRVYCGPGTYTNFLFERLPLGLHTLQLEDAGRSPFKFHDDLLGMIHRTRKSEGKLSTIQILIRRDASEFRALAAACQCADIHFTVYYAEEPSPYFLE